MSSEGVLATGSAFSDSFDSYQTFESSLAMMTQHYAQSDQLHATESSDAFTVQYDVYQDDQGMRKPSGTTLVGYGQTTYHTTVQYNCNYNDRGMQQPLRTTFVGYAQTTYPATMQCNCQQDDKHMPSGKTIVADGQITDTATRNYNVHSADLGMRRSSGALIGDNDQIPEAANIQYNVHQDNPAMPINHFQEERSSIQPVGLDVNESWVGDCFVNIMEDPNRESDLQMHHEVGVTDSRRYSLGEGPSMEMETKLKFALPEATDYVGVNNSVHLKVDATQCYEKQSNYQDVELPDRQQHREEDWTLNSMSHSEMESTVKTTVAGDKAQNLGNLGTSVHQSYVGKWNDQDIALQAGQQQWDRSMACSDFRGEIILGSNSRETRSRSSHSPEDLLKLRTYFNCSPYINYMDVLTLEEETKLDIKQIRTFFNNERNRQKISGKTEGLKKRNRHSDSQKAMLEAWVANHLGDLSPKTWEKKELADETKLSLDQVSYWFESKRKKERKATLIVTEIK